MAQGCKKVLIVSIIGIFSYIIGASMGYLKFKMNLNFFLLPIVTGIAFLGLIITYFINIFFQRAYHLGCGSSCQRNSKCTAWSMFYVPVLNQVINALIIDPSLAETSFCVISNLKIHWALLLFVIGHFYLKVLKLLCPLIEFIVKCIVYFTGTSHLK